MKKFTELHSTKLFTFEVPSTFNYAKPSDLVAKHGLHCVHKVNAFFINRGGYFGDQPVAATDNELVNLPSNLLNMVKDVLASPESVTLVNNGKVGFKCYTYSNKFGEQVGIDFVDL